MADSKQLNTGEVEQPLRDEIAEQYLEQLQVTPYQVQEEALFSWFACQQGLMVCAPTGMGKTLIAEAAIYEALHLGRRAYYTTPLIALTDQKFRELRETVMGWGYSPDSVGLVTGNRKVNPDAPIQVVVAEILLNRLLDPQQRDWDEVWAVVMDEFHSFNDPERGIVWEFGLGLLPSSVRTLLLSATVGNSREFVQWLQHRHHRTLNLVEGTERKVPLTFQWIDDQLLSEQLELMFDGQESLRLTPALVFCFNREQCWTVAEMFKGKALVTTQQKQELLAELDQYDWSQGAGPKLKQILQRGVGVHHAGVLPRYRRIVEDLFQKKLLSVVVCTETLAAGINLPARSVVLPTLMKGPPDKKTLVEPSSAHQMFGRAGRPQFDSRGYVIVLAHEDDVKYNRWKEKYDQIPEDTKDPGLRKAKKQLKKKMPRRREGVVYWSQKQFEQLQAARPANLESRGPIPWQLLAYMLNLNTDVDLLRQLIGKRLLPERGMEGQHLELNRRLVALWRGRFIDLEPAPPFVREDLAAAQAELAAAAPSAASNEPDESAQPGPPTETEASGGSGFGEGIAEASAVADVAADSEHVGGGGGGLFDVALRAEPQPAGQPSAAGPSAGGSAGSPKGVRQQLLDYRPLRATPTTRMADFIRLRAIHPVFGIYLIEQLAEADPEERILAIESLLEMPASVGKAIRVPLLEEMPPGPLAINVLHPRLLQLGLATGEELMGRTSDEEQDDQGGGQRRVWTEEPPPRILTLPYKIQRLFQHDNPGIDDVKIKPVWVIGRLREFAWNFNNYITSYKLQKQEGMIFRHMLRGILLFEQVAEVAPRSCDYYQWSDFWYGLADDMIACCQGIDAASTQEVLAEVSRAEKSRNT